MVFTTIWHEARKTLGLSCNEYCIADMINLLSANPKAPTAGWCSQSRGNMAVQMGLTRRTVIDIVNLLEKKKIVERGSHDMLRTTSIWQDAIVPENRGEITSQPVKNLHPSCAESSHLPVQKVHTEIYIENNTKKGDTILSTESSVFDPSNTILQISKPVQKHKPPKQPKKTETELNVAFDLWWEVYDKKVGRADCVEVWPKLTDEERETALDHSKKLVRVKIKQFRKDPIKYLRMKAFRDEIIENDAKPSIIPTSENYSRIHSAPNPNNVTSKRR